MGLALNFWVNPESCGNHEYYENYIRFMAVSDWNGGLGTSFAYIRKTDEGEKMLGFITLRASSYTKIYEGRLHGDPAIEIFNLAVSKDVEHQGIGAALMKFAFSMADKIGRRLIGIRYVTVCADKEAVGFYEKMGFGKIEEYGEIPRDNMNEGCVPMFLRIRQS